MATAKKTNAESERLRALIDLGILDTPMEERYDRITRLARQLLRVPISAITLIDEKRQWFKSIHGLNGTETPIQVAFCAYTILEDKPMVVPDALKDERFRDNPFVTGHPYIRFYAGIPLTIGGKYRIGSLCVVDVEPRDITDEQLLMLKDLKNMAETELNALAMAKVQGKFLRDFKAANSA